MKKDSDRKMYLVAIMIFVMCTLFLGCGTNNEFVADDVQLTEALDGNDATDDFRPTEVLEGNDTPGVISEAMAYDGVTNYCHSTYDWSIAQDNPDIMYVTMGEESETEYQLIFRSYTGAFVYFYVDKVSGTTRLIECVPNLGIEEAAGTIELFDYLNP